MESVRQLQQQGTTVLYTTQYMEEVQAIASRVVILDQGHVIAQGTIDELVERIQHEEKIRMEVAESSKELLEKLQYIDGVKQVTQDGHKLQSISRAGSGNLDRVLAVAREAGGVRAVSAEKPTLEDVFLTLTGKQLRDGGGFRPMSQGGSDQYSPTCPGHQSGSQSGCRSAYRQVVNI